jgi:hypothetical protein
MFLSRQVARNGMEVGRDDYVVSIHKVIYHVMLEEWMLFSFLYFFFRGGY